jgi:hypothetical protein
MDEAGEGEDVVGVAGGGRRRLERGGVVGSRVMMGRISGDVEKGKEGGYNEG